MSSVCLDQLWEQSEKVTTCSDGDGRCGGRGSMGAANTWCGQQWQAKKFIQGKGSDRRCDGRSPSPFVPARSSPQASSSDEWQWQTALAAANSFFFTWSCCPHYVCCTRRVAFFASLVAVTACGCLLTTFQQYFFYFLPVSMSVCNTIFSPYVNWSPRLCWLMLAKFTRKKIVKTDCWKRPVLR